METKKYDYQEIVKEDVIDYVNDWLEYTGEIVTSDNKSELYERLSDEMFTCDRVTGNGSGSYTFSAWQAEDNLCHNLDLYFEAVSEFGTGSAGTRYDPEAMDVTIRCYLFPQYLTEYLDELVEEAEK